MSEFSRSASGDVQKITTCRKQQTGKRMMRVPKGRRAGQAHPNAVLTDSEVEAMRDLREQGQTYQWLAEKFEVSKSSVAKICKYQRR